MEKSDESIGNSAAGEQHALLHPTDFASLVNEENSSDKDGLLAVGCKTRGCAEWSKAISRKLPSPKL